MQVDKDHRYTANNLWRHVFGEQRGLLALWSAKRSEAAAGPVKGSVRTRYFDYPSETEDALSYALEQSEAGRDAYFCTHLLNRPQRVKENAADVLTLWGESDGAEVPNGYLKPTAVIESSPGRYHLYWRLTEPLPPETAEALNKRIANAIGADPSGFDLTQLLRIPGTINHKYEGRPTVRVVEIAGEARSYVPLDLERFLPPVEAPVAKPGGGEDGDPGEDSNTPPVALDAAALRVWRGIEQKTKEDGRVDRSASLMKIGRVLYDAGANKAIIVAALSKRDKALGWRKYTDRRDAGKCYATIYEELEKNGRNPKIGLDFGGGFASEASPEKEGKKRRRRSQADRLIDYALARLRPTHLFVDQMGAPHALVDGEAVPLNTRSYNWLRGLMWEEEGISTGGEALKTAAGTLSAFAASGGKAKELHTRSAFYEGAVYYQLGTGRVVKIDRDGWELDEAGSFAGEAPVVFRSIPNLKPLPDPERGGSLEGLEALVNLKTERDKRMFKAYAVTLPLPHVPRPILQTTGVMGSGKTTAGRVVKRLLDPTSPETVRMDPRDFLQKASHSYVVMLDNLNSIPEWGVDTLCRLVTGEADSKRSLYTDDEDFIYEMKRAVILNGINAPTDRGDAQDRTLPVELDRIPDRARRSEEDLWAAFGAEHGKLLGAIFDALSGAIRERETLSLSRRPRLADWGEYAAAVYKALGWGEGLFLEDWDAVVKVQNQGTLDGSPVAQAIMGFMEDRDEWTGLANELHARLEDEAEELNINTRRDKSWPKSPSWLWRRMKEVLPLLTAMGIEATTGGSRKTGTQITLTKTPMPGGPDTGGSSETDAATSAATEYPLQVSASEDGGSRGSIYGYSGVPLSRTKEGKGLNDGENAPKTHTGRELPINTASTATTPEEVEKLGRNGPVGGAENRRLAQSEVERVDRFVWQGMKPELARREVLGASPAKPEPWPALPGQGHRDGSAFIVEDDSWPRPSEADGAMEEAREGEPF